MVCRTTCSLCSSMYTAWCSVQIGVQHVQCMQYNVVYSVQHSQCAARVECSMQHAQSVHGVQCVACMQYGVACSVQFTAHSMQYVVCSMCSVYSGVCIVYTACVLFIVLKVKEIICTTGSPKRQYLHHSNVYTAVAVHCV